MGEEGRLPVPLVLVSLAAIGVFTSSDHSLGTIYTSVYGVGVRIIIRSPLQYPEHCADSLTLLFFPDIFLRWMLLYFIKDNKPKTQMTLPGARIELFSLFLFFKKNFCSTYFRKV